MAIHNVEVPKENYMTRPTPEGDMAAGYISTEPTTTRTTLDAADPKKDPQVVKVEQALETLRKRLEEAEEANDEPRWRVLAQLLLTEEPKLQRLRERVSANPSG
eukprot:symbB.v1.2.030151.t1/scaffold3362.1/size63757/4